MTASADPWRKSLTRQPYRKIDERMLVANIMASLEELQSLLPPDIDEPQEPDSPEFKEYMRKINRLRRDLRKLKVPQKRNLQACTDITDTFIFLKTFDGCMAKKALDRTVPTVWARKVKKGKRQVIHEYWVASWRDRDGNKVEPHLGAVTKVTEAEALAKALILKTASVGPLVERQIIQPSTGHGMQPVEDVAKIKAEREAFIAEWVEDVVHSPADTCYKMEPHGWMLCNACGADFRAYPSEARHCPTCTSSDIREMTDRERDFDTRYCRIEDGIYAIKHIRDEPIAEMLKSLRAKKTAATLEIKEGWIDANPENRLELHLRENDNYCWITRCGDWWMTGYEAAGEASDGLVRHCKTCIGEQGAKRKSRCWMSADEWRRCRKR